MRRIALAVVCGLFAQTAGTVNACPGCGNAVALKLRDIVQFWNTVFPERALEAAGRTWKIAGGYLIESLATPLVDVANGYIRCKYIYKGATTSAVAALFTSKAGFPHLVCSYDMFEPTGRLTQVTAHAWTKVGPVESTTLMPTVTMADFLDERRLADDPTTRELAVHAGSVHHELPQYGTTVLIRPFLHKSAEDAPVGVDRTKARYALHLFGMHQKYKSIRLAWNESTGTFAVAGKDPR